MAKGQVTEEELASGLKGIGDFGALSGAPRVRRDNPFRDSRTDSAPTKLVKEIERVPATTSAVPGKESAVEDSLKPAPPSGSLAAVPKPRSPERKPRAERLPEIKQSTRKADLFTERVTLQMSPEMRDEIDELARQLQRAKTSKDERITANTVMRVAIRSFLDAFEVTGSDSPNNEEDLLRIARSRK